jgi:hypothetical protein|tara:strand:+ start:1298 stop:1525 length:228 start_codon:yes stop_codon:yes gene_type:complete
MSFVSTFDHTNPMTDNNINLEMLTAREQLMEDIDCIVDETFMEMFGWEDVDKWSNHKDKLTSILCDAVCKNFPTN